MGLVGPTGSSVGVLNMILTPTGLLDTVGPSCLPMGAVTSQREAPWKDGKKVNCRLYHQVHGVDLAHHEG